MRRAPLLCGGRWPPSGPTSEAAGVPGAFPTGASPQERGPRAVCRGVTARLGFKSVEGPLMRLPVAPSLPARAGSSPDGSVWKTFRRGSAVREADVGRPPAAGSLSASGSCDGAGGFRLPCLFGPSRALGGGAARVTGGAASLGQ